MRPINIYHLTHTYSPASMDVIIASHLSKRDIWNIISLFQLVASEIDSTHAATQAGAATFLIKYFDATIYNPNFHYNKSVEQEIDLFKNWELGLVQENGDCLVRKDYENQINWYKQHYEFHNKLDIHTFLLDLISRDHKIFNGDVGDSSSAMMDNPTWEKLLAEGVYNKINVGGVVKLTRRTIQEEGSEKCPQSDHMPWLIC